MPRDPEPKESKPLDAIGAVLTPEQLAQLIAGITLAVQNSSGSSSNPDAMAELMKGITGMVEANSKLTEQFRRSQKHENPHYEDVSVYNFDPRCDFCKTGAYHPAVDGDLPKKAHPKPPLKYDVLMCNGPVRGEWLTIAEAELINAFERDMTARGGAWTAQLRRDGTKTQLVLDMPYRGIDVRQDLPPLINILSELLYGEIVTDPSQAMALIKKLEAKIADLESRLPQTATA